MDPLTRKGFFVTFGFNSVGFVDGAALFEALRKRMLTLIISDAMLPETDGIEALKPAVKYAFFSGEK